MFPAGTPVDSIQHAEKQTIASNKQNPLRLKRLLVIGEEKGFRHEAISHAMATIERLDRETHQWETHIRTADQEKAGVQRLEPE